MTPWLNPFFQKFQLSRFQMMLEEDQPKEELINVIKDLREGLKVPTVNFESC